MPWATASELGQTYGYMGWRSLDFANSQVVEAGFERVRLAGYSGDFPGDRLREFGAIGETAGADLGCSILGVENNMLLHDCDTNPGASD
jgi:protease YdgD